MDEVLRIPRKLIGEARKRGVDIESRSWNHFAGMFIRFAYDLMYTCSGSPRTVSINSFNTSLAVRCG